MRASTIVLLLTFISCKTARQAASTQTLDFGSFTIDTPTGWTKIKMQGIDDLVGKIAIDRHDTLEYNLGVFASSLEQLDEPDDDGKNPDTFSKSNVSRRTINGRKAKIFTPKGYSNGMTGIYFDSLWKDGQDIVKFNLVGQNLNRENQIAVIRTFQTLQFRQKQ